MAISAGILTERVQMQVQSVTQNKIGEQEVTYTDLAPFCVFPAQVKFLKSSNAEILGQVLDTMSIMVTTRYSESLLKVRRIILKDNKYDVDGVPNGDRVNRTITYTCNLVIE